MTSGGNTSSSQEFKPKGNDGFPKLKKVRKKERKKRAPTERNTLFWKKIFL